VPVAPVEHIFDGVERLLESIHALLMLRGEGAQERQVRLMLSEAFGLPLQPRGLGVLPLEEALGQGSTALQQAFLAGGEVG
jgi:hypothetical protein